MMTPLMAYYRPSTVTEAVTTFRQLRQDGHHPAYWSGGTEILTRRRLHEIYPGAVVDIKGIPEVGQHAVHGRDMIFGAGISLWEIARADYWPLLTATADRVADHTSRVQITLGGNIASHLPYREAVLPWMLVDATAWVGTIKGIQTRPFCNLFDGRLVLADDEFLVALQVSRDVASFPYTSRKMTRRDWVNYPLVSISATKDVHTIHAAFSGYALEPFRDDAIDRVLSEEDLPYAVRAERAVAAIPRKAISDIHGSAAYRKFVTQYTLASIIEVLEGGQ